MKTENAIKHEFDGACKPSQPHNWGMNTTFSVGCFPVLPKASGKGTKRGGTKVRVIGYVSNPEAVYAKAREVCTQLDAGTYAGPKSVRVKARTP